MKFQKEYDKFQYVFLFVMNRPLLMQPQRTLRPAACVDAHTPTDADTPVRLPGIPATAVDAGRMGLTCRP